MKFISVVTACYNEEDNIELIYNKVKEIFDNLKSYTYEHIFIDNASTDRTALILKDIAGNDKKVKIIVNARNFGHIRSPNYGLQQAKGDAVVSIVADLQDPPHMIADFIRKWEEGYKIVIGVKTQSEESSIMFKIRKSFYGLINKLSEVELIKNFTGFGLYDKQVIDVLRNLNDPYPYFRGIIADIGFEVARIEYKQPARQRGITKNNFYTLYDMAMLGITNHSKVPLRLATMLGFSLSIISLLVAFGYAIYKLIFWKSFSLGIAPVVVGLFFFASVQLFFLGILGEYIGSIHTQVLKRPLVIEKERINFDD
ncbi:MAG: dolichol monophosphate mannose synthase [Nitrospirae bacterium RBG_13_39_12]|nr:MAG: dolichol monophosphate mannose synthase [Nitrospirae bacterium RBG_13_39_12]